jgi:hypothetical protein
VRTVTAIHVERLTWLDASLLGLMSVTMKWTVPAEWIAAGQSWLVPFVSFAAVSYQSYARAWTGACCALAPACAMVTGLVIALPEGAWSDSLITASWALVLCLLGRMLRILVERGGGRRDRRPRNSRSCAGTGTWRRRFVRTSADCSTPCTTRPPAAC